MNIEPAHGPPEEACRSKVLPPFRCKPVAAQPPRGFTLLELLVVIAVIGIALAIVFPRIPAPSGTYLKTDAGRVSSLITYLNEASVAKRVYYRLWFDLEKEGFRVEASKDGGEYAQVSEPRIGGIRLRQGVELEDMVLPGLGKVSSGTVSVVIAPSGNGEPFTLHLKAEKGRITISFNPYSGKVIVKEGYV
ncbi:MAG: prepilin-type N-terminal cleavage/methylation domain-containing protein [Deltaproteobacteria bacterium]|nr:prepilin-type N-terminal cleavage/methylation domain-containing protein [Deltaproteobacteria bacterium]